MASTISFVVVAQKKWGVKGAFLKVVGVDLEAPTDNSILNYLSLIKCAGVQLLNRNNQTRNFCSNSGRRRPELPRSSLGTS